MLVCVRLSDARPLSVSVPTYWDEDPAVVEADSAAEPERKHSSQQAGGLKSQQEWSAREPLFWKFPADPVDCLKKPPIDFKPRRPVETNRVVTSRVAVRCGESKIQVEVSQDLLGLGKLIKPQDITLGSCPATEIDDSSHVLVFESELHKCGSARLMTENALIYAFTLVYNPKVSNRSRIVRSQSVVIGVECHYPRGLKLMAPGPPLA
ncbi:zona pellucida sperm-binding protein 3-like [Parambassis ranga]|uniref:Zona pellucida sperm-binding protein 3-like n=1 Tax=Parambassis ranga TaxID=210632 RepID=A0A6P7JFT3_9TELE|nr:zona pellucida sperm-binding protein 3-like [Parambassis ranga]